MLHCSLFFIRQVRTVIFIEEGKALSPSQNGKTLNIKRNAKCRSRMTTAITFNFPAKK